MKQVLAIILTVCMLSQCCLRVGIYAWFRANQDTIAKTLCENRDRPELKCCGKCYLKKQLKKADEQEQGSGTGKSNVRTDKQELAVFILPSGITRPAGIITVDNRRPPLTDVVFRGSGFVSDIFHPPGRSLLTDL